MIERRILIRTLLFLLISCSSTLAAEKPNIVYILADDLGIGDVSCFNPQSRIRTPNIDRIAKQGMMFTDAHSASAVCTPTRAGILTGRYPWRTRLKSGVLYGWSPHLIEPSRLTVPALLKQQGYHTACIGKWHLGMDWAGAKRTDATKYDGAGIDYSSPIKNGPTSLGFDSFFGIAASLDMPPFIWIENDQTVGLPTATKKWVRQGPAGPDFEAIDVLPTLTKKAIEYLNDRAKSKDQPFFLYLPLNSPHTPIVPTKKFQGKSGLNAYADFVLETDDALGQILNTLDTAGLTDNTLVIFTSDNGCSPAAGIPALNQLGHDPSAGFRGHKADIFEGGHRIPFVARWPGKVKEGSTCADPICLNDLLATAAEITGTKLPENAGEDSVSILPDLLGSAMKPVREAIVHASINGSLSIRQGNWKLEVCRGSGGWSPPRTPAELKGLPAVQLYNLSVDPHETKNLEEANVQRVQVMMGLLGDYIENGRSTPGARQENDTPTSMRATTLPAASE